MFPSKEEKMKWDDYGEIIRLVYTLDSLGAKNLVITNSEGLSSNHY